MGADDGHPDDIALPDGPLSFVSQDAADERDDAYERRIADLTAERAADRRVVEHQAESIAALTVERDELKAENDRLQRIVDSVRSKTALVIVAEKMAAEDARTAAEAERDEAIRERDVALTRKPTHICLDCGAVGYAGGYHDHGGGEAGDTCTIAALIDAAKNAGEVRDERDQARADSDGFRRASEHHREFRIRAEAERNAAREDRDTLLKAIAVERDLSVAASQGAPVDPIEHERVRVALYDKANEIVKRTGYTGGQGDG